MNREEAILLLKHTRERLLAGGTDRLPQRSDLTPEEQCLVKAFLGPWPRALEAAGLKPVQEDRKDRKEQKRIEQKRRRTRYRLGLAAGNEDTEGK